MAGNAANLQGMLSQMAGSFEPMLKSTDPTALLTQRLQTSANGLFRPAAPKLELDMTDPAALEAEASKLYPTDPAAALQLSQEASRLRKEIQARVAATGEQGKLAQLRQRLIDGGANPVTVENASMQDLHQIALKMDDEAKVNKTKGVLLESGVKLGMKRESLEGMSPEEMRRAINEFARDDEAMRMIDAGDFKALAVKYPERAKAWQAHTDAVARNEDRELKKLAEAMKDKDAKESARHAAAFGLKLIDTLIGHKGREAAVGGSSFWPTRPGGDAADYLVQFGSLKGKLFMEGYKNLKGGGTITEIEGQKAEAALAAIDLSQSEEAHALALDDLRRVFEAGGARSEGINVPVYGTRVNGKTFLGGDPRNPKNWSK